jgi:hypothetical protein
MLFGACKNRRSGGNILRNNIILILRNMLRLLDTAEGFPSSPILITLMMEAIHSFDTSVLLDDEGDTSILTRGTRRSIPEDGILHSHRRENLKFYIALTSWTL